MAAFRLTLSGAFALALVLVSAGCRGAHNPPEGLAVVDTPPAQRLARDQLSADGGAGEREVNAAVTVTPRAMDGSARGAALQLTILRALPPPIVKHAVSGGKPDASGAVGHNRQGWMGAQYQRSAASYVLYAVAENDRGAAEDGWRAADAAFARQEQDGSFGALNQSGTPSAMKDVYSDIAFWLAHFCQAALVIRESPLADVFRARLDAMIPKVKKATALLAQGKEVLTAREASATNRYFIDALAYALSGALLDDRSLVDTGAYFVDLGLAKQHPEGFFEESNGSDTSYNAVSIWMLQIYDLYFPDPRHEAALAKATRWQLGHVQSSGEIDTAGNTRTGMGQEKYFGKAKEINYPEVTMALLYYGEVHHDAASLDAARRIYEYKKSAP
jgi:hypothetical protein